ncbi:MAG TPA: PilZ domain-containing protein [Xanthobacteraceae bacterium]|nr:PilZ domain-containing protein [Xanthobacteraceae bacterium]
MIERRTHPRHKAFIKGRIYFNNRLSSMDCIIRETSEQGARLEFSENVTLPDIFELYLPSKEEYFRAHVIWRKGHDIGVAWTPETSLNPRADQGRTDYHLADRVTRLERELALLHKRLDAMER